MKHGIILAEDMAGAQYVLSGDKALAVDTDIRRLKDALGVATQKGLTAKAGAKAVQMRRAILLSSSGVVCRRRFPLAGEVLAAGV